MRRRRSHGFTLVEVMMGASVLAVVMVALTGSIAGQAFLKAHARNLTLAMNDATRVMEEIRKQNSGGAGTCARGVPSARPPAAAYRSWDAWLADAAASGGGGGKAVESPDSTRYELIAVSCQGDADGDGTFETPCGVNGLTPQIGGNEWDARSSTTAFDPIRVTVSVGWMQQRRVIGGTSLGNEFALQGQQTTSGKNGTTTSSERLITNGELDLNGNGVIDSQAMLSTFMTCR